MPQLNLDVNGSLLARLQKLLDEEFDLNDAFSLPFSGSTLDGSLHSFRLDFRPPAKEGQQFPMDSSSAMTGKPAA